MQSRTKQMVLFSAKVLLSIGVLVYIARGLDLHQLRTTLLTVDPAMFLLRTGADRPSNLSSSTAGGN